VLSLKGVLAMLDLKQYCEYLYHSLLIPIYLYENNELTHCYPHQETDTYPPSQCLKSILDINKTVTFTMTFYYSYYGYIKVENSNSFLVIGPVNAFPYSTEVLTDLHKKFSVNQTNQQAFFEFFRKIPTHYLDTFISTILFINYSINNAILTKNDIIDSDGFSLDASIFKKYSEDTYEAKEEGTLYNNYTLESELIHYIETGNIGGLKEFYNQAKNAKVGIIAPNDLRQFKNMFIVLVTLCSRAAIKGGLSPSIAYPLSETYMQQIELITDMDSIRSLLVQVQIDFTKRVANSLLPVVSDNILFQAIQYVHENTNKNITVADVANHINFSRTYLSRKFKKELGFELSSFIRRCKLEEAKDLLLYSNKSISEISNYLRFSGQSHFQKSFKNQYGITPQTFRKSVNTK
jgi:AraC-like DNA-binding protein